MEIIMKPHNTIAAGEFKAKCLKIMDEVNTSHTTYTITKHGKPIAKLVPIPGEEKDYFGCLQDTITIHGDIIQPIDVEWEANQ